MGLGADMAAILVDRATQLMKRLIKDNIIEMVAWTNKA